MSESGYVVEIVKHGSGEVVKSMQAVTKRMAERIDSGANINLNHEQYYTRIVPAGPSPRE